MIENLRALRGFAAYILFFAWLDWITHRSLPFIILVGSALLLGAVFQAGIVRYIQALSLRDTSGWTNRLLNGWSNLPWKVRRTLVALTPLLYFVLRGQGTSGAGGAVLLGGAAVAVPVILLGDQIDRLLRRYYRRRNMLLPRWLRLILAPTLAVILAFAIVHGSLLDLPALFGGATLTPRSPVGLDGRFFLATLIAGACTVLLIRERGTS